MKEITVDIEFFEEVLGTASSDSEIHSRFVASKAPSADLADEEVAAIPEESNSVTVFPRDAEGRPVVYDYQVKGFFKDTCGMLRRVPGTHSSKVKSYKKVIDGLVFVSPRMIPLEMPKGTSLSTCERPLRASTMQGERNALAASEAAPAGTKLRFTVTVLNDSDEPLVREWLDYGQLRGLGQWRNSGKGRFLWVEAPSRAKA